MTGRKDDQSPEQIAKANRLRLAKEEGVRAMEDAQREAISVRQEHGSSEGAKTCERSGCSSAPARDQNGCKGETEKAMEMKRPPHLAASRFTPPCIGILS
jgi:hypothetical protein